ncbi:MAG: hypothetical protein CVU67_01350 [Deltaproteobacteria bacterium HGW-Deltaproteobacteria-24]|nr:MAG: hypothetical protein CVU67_01350 [Deltaproteobacteria bacterium HGW-Deltaproteobacteria-24]
MKNSQNIVIVEDDIFAQEFLSHTLNTLGYNSIFIASNANDAINFCKTQSADLIFMDINIEGTMDGIQCAREISLYYDIPIIFTTAYSDSVTIDEASYTNLYGFLVKPFTQKEVDIALKIIQRQLFSKNKLPNKIHLYKDSFYNFDAKTLIIDNQKITLSKNEISIIELLIKNKGTIVTYSQLKNSVWKKDISDSGIRDAFARLRKKASNLPISTHFGSGYSLDLE